MTVEIPIEGSLTLLLHPTEEGLLYRMKHVETYKEVIVGGELHVFIGECVAIEHAFVCQSLIAKSLTIVCIYSIKVAP